MSTGALVGLVLLLVLGIGLVSTNPTLDDYTEFVAATAQRAIGGAGQAGRGTERERVAQMLEGQGHRLIGSLIRTNTVRRDCVAFSLFETRLLEQRVLVLGIAHRFLPLPGAEEAIRKLGRFGATLPQ
jgi:hypothetical protein